MELDKLVNSLATLDSIHNVVPFEPHKDRLVLFDFSMNNTELSPEVINNTPAFIKYINHQLETSGAKYGIGGYGEERSIYSRSGLFGSNELNKENTSLESANATLYEEPRRLHLGIDIWGKPHTKVMAPFDGFVHSFAFNNSFGDYGSTIILSHSIGTEPFYTLYGHLSLASIKNLGEGEPIRRGDVFAEFGIPQENGYWPPHLHFQIIKDLQGMHGDYPGVCKASEKNYYLSNCPDPDLILRMLRYVK